MANKSRKFSITGLLHRSLMVMVLGSAALHGQSSTAAGPLPSSPFLYVGHWSYRYIDLLRDRGYFKSLSATVQPYRRSAVARAVLLESPSAKNTVESYWFSMLAEEFRGDCEPAETPDAEAARLVGKLTSEISTYSAKGKKRADFYLNPEVDVTIDHLSVGTRGTIDRALLHDPGYTGYRTDHFGARVTDGYGLWTFGKMYFVFGRYSENWSPIPGRSLIVSENPYSYDKLGLGFESKHLSFRSFFAKLDNFQDATRYLSAHRFDITLNNGMNFGFTETVIHGSASGRHKPLELAYLNPFMIFADVQLNDRKEANENLAIDAYVPLGRFNFRGQFLIDDFLLDGASKPPPNRKTSPDQLGYLFMIQANDVVLTNSQITLDYEQVGSYTYNLKFNRPWQSYTYINRGLGSVSNDHDAWHLGTKWFPLPRWVFNADLSFKRQGERTLFSHDYNDSTIVVGPFPRGIVEKSINLQVGALFQYSRMGFCEAVIGFDRFGNYQHQAGSNKNFLNFLIRIQYSVDHCFDH